MNNQTITINGVTVRKDVLLMELYNGTRTAGLGVFHDIGEMSVDSARRVLSEQDWSLSCDWVHGRPIKLTEWPDGTVRTDLYDRDAGEGAFQRAVERAAKVGA